MGTVEEVQPFGGAPAMRGDERMAEKKNSDARIRANNRYNEKAYDRINIAIPKGQKTTIQAAAEQEGESINGYVNKAVLDRLGFDEWPEVNADAE